MTAKRFTVHSEWRNLIADIKDTTGEIETLGEFVDLLNELNDECEFLKIDNEILEDGGMKYVELYHNSLKENEQLKQEIETLQELIAHFDIGDGVE